MSPDGQHVIFASGSNIYVANVDGSGRHIVSQDQGVTFAWSGDSARSAYTDNQNLTVVSADGKRSRPLDTPPNEFDGPPAWSRDGNFVAFTRSHGVFVIDADGTHLRKVASLSGGGLYASPQWSHDGKFLAVVGANDPFARKNLYAIRIGTGAIRRVAANVSENDPVWSPVADRVLYQRHDEIFAVNADGTGGSQLTKGAALGGATSPSWSPDGRRIVYSRGRSPGSGESPSPAGYDLWVMRADGSGKRALTDPSDGDTNELPTWVPGRPLAAISANVSGHIELRPRHVLRVHDVICGLAADAARVAILAGGCGSPTLEIWSPLAGAVERVSSYCWGYFGEVALARDSAAFTCFGESSLRYYAELHVVAAHRPDVTVAAYEGRKAYGKGSDQGPTLGDLRGRDGMIVFGVWQLSDDAARLTERVMRVRGKSFEPLTQSPGLRPLATDGGRVVVRRGDGRLLVLRADGSIASTFSRGRVRFTSVALAGTALVTARDHELDLNDVATGRQRAHWKVTVGQDLEVSNGLAVWTGEGGIHIFDFARGRDNVLRLRGAAPPFGVQLEPEGLFYSWSALRKRPPGRVAFVPRAELDRALRGG